ncbi:DegT/DnrJ/EryC1/StrS family aminotransferase [Maridesulfovibrio hydrothermalis]|uniref:Erythromycin biosynthesis sensory transduction protein eryC1 n=1 Tax=Maridesulfovibrio hydrothermalis AM13 = DSM 14728 TaxID=1121451 RepID=L0RAU9_9BACT|nr:DegT/DnrJ/EryC1/StrS family aminotransferase [Maridesulfovibrio hydrothermalis]CCO23315.1 Erythromycin biosynthesis sensory transduction protein eryC1 [Maridesulfovibrio hydrothermalis AM13 = DSM 14728]
MNEIKFLDVGWTYQTLAAKMDAAAKRVLESGWYILGDEVNAFEKEFALYTGAKHCIGTGNGLDSLELVLRAAGVGIGDDVLVPSNTFIATWLAVTRTGANIVPVEPVESTYTMDPEKLEAALTPATKAVIPVHLYGQPADMDPIMEFAEKHSLFVLTDAAQAHGAVYKRRMSGTLGHAAAFSFYPGKNLGAFGDGGAVTTMDDTIAENVHKIANYGSTDKYKHDSLGFNSRLDEMQAAFLRVKLDQLDNWNWRRRNIAEVYLKGLVDTPLVLPVVPEHIQSVWHLFVVRCHNRDGLIKHLEKNKIQASIHYPTPPHKQGAYRNMADLSLPISEAIHREVLSLPIGPHMTEEQAERVVECVKSYF